MTKANIAKLYAHFCKISEGDFSESDFNLDLKKGGKITMGEMTPERKQLMMADAKANKEKLEKKFGLTLSKEKAKE